MAFAMLQQRCNSSLGACSTARSSSSSSSTSSAPRRALLQMATQSPRNALVVTRAGGGAGGFDKSSNKKKADAIPDGFKRMDPELVGGSSAAAAATKSAAARPTKVGAGGAPVGVGWSKIGAIEEFVVGKATKPVITASGLQIMLYKWKGVVYCSDAASTAFQFPMTDAKVVVGVLFVFVFVFRFC